MFGCDVNGVCECVNGYTYVGMIHVVWIHVYVHV